MKDILPPETEVLETIRSIKDNKQMRKHMEYIYLHGSIKEKRMVLKALKEYTDFEEQFEEFISRNEKIAMKTSRKFKADTEYKIFAIYSDLKFGKAEQANQRF